MKAAKTQADTNLDFDGMQKMSSKRQPVSGNHWSGHSNDGRTVNFGRGSTVGNDGRCDPPKNTGGNPTKSAVKHPPVSSLKPLPPQGSVRDNINRGSQYRGPGGTMPKSPANPDKIRASQAGGPGYGAIKRGSRPVAPSQQDGINYGPNKQY